MGCGRNVAVNFTHSHATAKDKVRFVIDADPVQQPRLASTLILHAIDLVTRAAAEHVVVDRGHKHSGGKTEVCFWLHAPGAATRSKSTTKMLAPSMGLLLHQFNVPAHHAMC